MEVETADTAVRVALREHAFALENGRLTTAREWEFSVVGANLLDPHQPEQGFALSPNGVPTETERSVYARAVWRR